MATIDAERRIGNARGLRGLAERGYLVPGRYDEVVDAVWVLTAPEVYDRLVRRSGWPSSRYEQWLAIQLAATLAD